MEIYLVRHTQPEIEKGLIYGRMDVPLAVTFEDEKQKVLSQLPNEIDLVYSSPSSRCAMLAAAVSQEVIFDERLYELDFGNWEGETWDTIDRNASEYWMEDYMNRCPPEGETMLEMMTRVNDFWEEIKTLNNHQIAVITHGGVIRLLLVALNIIQINELWKRNIAFGEVIKIKI